MTKTEFIERAYSALEDVEALSRESLKGELLEWNEIIKNCIEAGGLVPTLPAKNSGLPRINAAAPFLKRALTDLRAIQLLITIGYTSQAASIAASLWENALTAAILADSESLTFQAKLTKFAEIPWPPLQLAKLNAKRELKIQYKGQSYAQKEFEDSWTITYYNYKWLCQIKHPTWQSAFHDVKSATTTKEQYALFPFPCNFPEDMHLKFMILGISTSKALEAIKSFFLSLECDEGDEGYSKFETKVNLVHFGVLKQMEVFAGKQPPVKVLDTKFIKTDFSTLIEKYGR